MAAHELHILQIVHIGGIGMDVVRARVGGSLDGARNVAIVHVCQTGSNFNVFHSFHSSIFYFLGSQPDMVFYSA